MNYCEYTPTSQDDLFVWFGKWAMRLFYGLLPLTLISSGTGSGKTNIMSYIPQILHANPGITYIIAPNEQLMSQIMEYCKAPRHGIELYAVNGLADDAERKITILLRQGRRPMVFFYNLGKDGPEFNKNARKLRILIQHFNIQKTNQLALFDELDSVLTNVTGGINPKLDISKDYIDEYREICGQANFSLNVFDIMRANKVKCIGLSATMNNLICSKLASMGYDPNDISIVNINPIKALYEKLRVIPINLTKIESYASYLVEAEKEQNKKILLVFPNSNLLKKFVKDYQTYFSKQLSYVEIIGDNSIERKTDSWRNDKLPNAKYVLGIDIVTTGYDISTHVKDVEFNLGILFRKLSDKTSQPLSKNDNHHLYMETSAKIIQTMSRLRKGGIFLLDEGYKSIESLYILQKQVFEKIRDGHNEFLSVGPPRHNQHERYIQQYMQNLLQNIRDDSKQRPTVDTILNDISQNFAKRDLKAESKTNRLDRDYWIHTIGLQLDRYMEKFIDDDKSLSPEEKASRKSQFSEERNRTLGGGGYKDPRLVDEDVKRKVIARATRCCHCGKLIGVNDDVQVCHFKRHDHDGPYSEDNLMYGHIKCDAVFDGGGIIHDPQGGYWREDTNLYKPDMTQVQCINAAYINHRWQWEMQQKRWVNVTEETFRDELKKNNYTYVYPNSGRLQCAN